MKLNPVIVVIGYNRPQTLLRLLRSLAMANYPTEKVELVLSIDFSDSEEGEATRQVARDFEWMHGNKRLIFHNENLGLRNHVLSCGDLSQEYERIIVLEDDLSVGPEFYRYAMQALEFSHDQPAIAGVSLYNYQTNFIRRLPFEPIHDGYDNYYLQIASSRGQCWNASQWLGFRSWYDSLPKGDEGECAYGHQLPNVHSIISDWPPTSWLKYFIAYLVESNKYFIFPRIAHSTNHGDIGTHARKSRPVYHVPLCARLGTLRLSSPEQSLAVYDSYFELEPAKVRLLAPLLQDYDFATDLYGSKDLSKLDVDYVLTSRKSASPPKICFPLETKPLEFNLLTPSEPQNSYFRLVPTTKLEAESCLDLSDRRVFEYFYTLLSVRKIARSLIGYWLNR